uniref:Uncharacterized protein n=1 Tax=Faxonius propinquus nudivirus TaxID=3139431 RepID=A0AAU8GCZ2_9VIRU
MILIIYYCIVYVIQSKSSLYKNRLLYLLNIILLFYETIELKKTINYIKYYLKMNMLINLQSLPEVILCLKNIPNKLQKITYMRLLFGTIRPSLFEITTKPFKKIKNINFIHNNNRYDLKLTKYPIYVLVSNYLNLIQEYDTYNKNVQAYIQSDLESVDYDAFIKLLFRKSLFTQNDINLFISKYVQIDKTIFSHSFFIKKYTIPITKLAKKINVFNGYLFGSCKNFKYFFIKHNNKICIRKICPKNTVLHNKIKEYISNHFILATKQQKGKYNIKYISKAIKYIQLYNLCTQLEILFDNKFILEINLKNDN